MLDFYLLILVIFNVRDIRVGLSDLTSAIRCQKGDTVSIKQRLSVCNTQ